MSHYEILKAEEQNDRNKNVPLKEEKLLTDESIIGFGPHRYMRLGDVPVSFFVWMVTQEKEYPRVSRPPQWTRVMLWLRNKKKD